MLMWLKCIDEYEISPISQHVQTCYKHVIKAIFVFGIGIWVSPNTCIGSSYLFPSIKSQFLSYFLYLKFLLSLFFFT